MDFDSGFIRGLKSGFVDFARRACGRLSSFPALRGAGSRLADWGFRIRQHQMAVRLRREQTLALAITCHAPYLEAGYLREAVESVERQSVQPAEKIVILDGCAPPDWLAGRRGWSIDCTAFGDPGLCRNRALALTRSPWITYLDADNCESLHRIRVLTRAIRNARPEVGFCYTDIVQCSPAMRREHTMAIPDYHYWMIRHQNMVDSSAVWRRSALESVNGWAATDNVEDWVLAMEMTRYGWTGWKAPGYAPLLYRVHGNGRFQGQHVPSVISDSIWEWKTFSLLTVFAGRERLFDDWVRFVETADLPPRTELVVVDDSQNAAFRKRLVAACARFAESRFPAVRYLASEGEASPFIARADPELSRHTRIARAINTGLRAIGSDMILMVEDDVFGPADGFRRLIRPFNIYGKLAAVAGAYPLAEHRGLICGSRARDTFADCLPWSQVRSGTYHMGILPGGFTVWENAAVKPSLPLIATRDPDGKLSGWDVNLCRRIGRTWDFLLDTDVVCEHRANRPPVQAAPVSPSLSPPGE